MDVDVFGIELDRKFTTTVVLTLVGVSVFLFRGDQGLNIDFVGGTAYGAQLTEARDIGTIRDLLDGKRQHQLLQVQGVRQTDEAGYEYEIAYAPLAGVSEKVKVRLGNRPPGDTPEQRADDLRKRAQELPDLSVEQIFLTTEPSEGGKSRFFTIRTREKEPALVEASIDRLLQALDGGEAGRLRANLLQGVRVLFSNAAAAGGLPPPPALDLDRASDDRAQVLTRFRPACEAWWSQHGADAKLADPWLPLCAEKKID